MNSLFNYELDERAIRLTLRDTDLEFNESSWEDFDRNYTVVAQKPATEWKLPKVQMNINRNVLVPVFFIALLGGISALLFSFADFKTNSTVREEKALAPNPDNYKKPEEVKVNPVVKKEENKAPLEPSKVPSSYVQPNENSVAQNVQKTEVTDSNVSMTKNNVPAISTPSGPAIEQSTVKTAPVENVAQSSSPIVAKVNKSESTSSSTNSSSKQQNNSGTANYRNSKRKRHVTPEQIETIKVPSLTGQDPSTQEPELELKLN